MSIILEPLAHNIIDNICERSCKIKRIVKGIIESETLLWFQFDKEITPPADDDCDSYLLAVIMDAMKENQNIEINGSISKGLLSNLIEYQAAWVKWLPDTYSQVDITCNNIRKPDILTPGAICAFSGGVDATFSVWMHSQSKFSYRTQDIQLCSIVHGFDIPIEDENAFVNATKTAKETLSSIELELYPIKTNYRKISKVSWEHAFSCALVATLNNFKSKVGTCIVGSSEPYNSLVIPWGSSPITDHLLSSDDFVVLHDGASHSRTEKVKEISQWKAGIDKLRVCWQGDLKDRNCGVCEKCVRTKLNFLAVNSSIPACFPPSDIIRDLHGINLKHDAVLAEWKQIYEYSINNNIDEPWLTKVEQITHNKKTSNELKETLKKLIKLVFKR